MQRCRNTMQRSRNTVHRCIKHDVTLIAPKQTGFLKQIPFLIIKKPSQQKGCNGSNKLIQYDFHITQQR
jgi:hypothetical protein